MQNESKIIAPAKGLCIIVPPGYRLQGSIPAEELVPILMKYVKKAKSFSGLFPLHQNYQKKVILA